MGARGWRAIPWTRARDGGIALLSGLLLLGSSFLASAVEMVEALTIVFAVGLTNNWRTALLGVVAALIALGVVVGILGPSLVHYVPLDGLRVFIGVLLLIFGMQWIRKAILRASGRKALHDEDAIFQREVAGLSATAGSNDLEWTGFVVSFKGVFLEGLEVAFIVLTFGTNSGRFDWAAGGALLAFVLIGGIGVVVRRPLSNVPENAIKFVVGIALMTFGTFWGGEGAGVNWTLGDATLPVLALVYALCTYALLQMMQRTAAPALPAISGGSE